MISEMLQEARDFEKSYGKYADAERPLFHVTGTIGWINDPNGFSIYKDEYHLFYQYYPYDTKWGPMHWGHAKTKDFITWEHLPAALAPDTYADRNGCFSGGAIQTPDGKHLIMYTGVYKKQIEDGSFEEHQHQCIAIGDGLNYEKYEGNPVLGSKNLPAGASPLDFRDPYIFRMGDKYYSVCGNRPEDGSGSLLVFESEDALRWKYKTVLETCNNEYGKMWECPAFFELNGMHVILVSPQEMAPMGMEFHAGYGTVALIGNFDKEKFAFERETIQAIDYGIDFYAPQVVKALDGRQIMIAWMENWTNTGSKLPKRRLFGAMTIPRELEIREDGRMIQNPVRELENYRGRRVVYKNVVINEECNLAGVHGRFVDLTVTVKPIPGGDYEWFKLNIAKDGIHGTSIRYKPHSSKIRIDRTKNGGRMDIVHTREFLAFSRKGEIKLRVIIDGNLVELFVNDGEQAASFKLYSKDFTAEAISFESDAQVSISVEKYELLRK